MVIEIKPENPGTDLITVNDAQLDLFFKIHEKVNSESEEIQKSYNNNILVCFDDIKELHHKTIQSIESLKPAKSSIGVRIAISHNQGESEKFNSFEEFSTHNTTSPNPTANIIMKYSFTLCDEEENTIENYKITNIIRSRIAELSQIEKEAPPFVSRALISSLVTTTAKISVEYTDYVKARHFTAMFDEWVESCDESPDAKLINFFKSISHLITRFGRLFIYGLLAFFTINAIDANIINDDVAVKFLIAYVSIFVIVGGFSHTFLSKIERSIDGYLEISYLNINKGDAKLIKAYGNRNKQSLSWVGVGLLGTVVVGLVTSFSYDLIKLLIIG